MEALSCTLPAGKYDVKTVDEDGDECVVNDIKIAVDQDVVSTGDDLAGSQAATEEEE